MMLNLFQIESLSTFIEENIRASKVSGIVFIDPQSYEKRLRNKQNHVIFGRRGAGKTILARTLEEMNKQSYLLIFLNMEDQKDKTFVNILLSVIVQILRQLRYEVNNRLKWYSPKIIYRGKIFRIIDDKIKKVERQLSNPEVYKYQETNIGVSEKGSAGEVKSNSIIIKGNFKHVREKKILLEGEVEKINSLLTVNDGLKELFDFVISRLNLKGVYLVLDDFYFVRKDIQPVVIDLFHRLSKDLKLYLKIATIKNRTNLYKAFGGSFYGVEIGNDVHEINLDYTLNEFQILFDFLKLLLKKIIDKVDPKLSSDDIFTDEAFIQICLASGGVPRDFLHLLNSLLANYDIYSFPFTSDDIIDVAVRNIYAKKISLIKDTIGRDDLLDIFINYIVDTIFNTSETNLFLIPLIELEMFLDIKQMINDLVDLKMIHLISPLIKLRNSERFACYMIDIGLYKLPLNQSFKEKKPKLIEGRLWFDKSDLRSSPVLILEKLNSYINDQSSKYN